MTGFFHVISERAPGCGSITAQALSPGPHADDFQSILTYALREDVMTGARRTNFVAYAPSNCLEEPRSG